MDASLNKKKEQLGVNYSTASYHLVKDLLYDFAKKLGKLNCYHCNQEITRDKFSIEHKEPWLDSEDPKNLFFDLDNIAFSHLSCNCAASRPKKSKSKCGSVTKYVSGCRCLDCKEAKAIYRKQKYDPIKRKLCYINNGT